MIFKWVLFDDFYLMLLQNLKNTAPLYNLFYFQKSKFFLGNSLIVAQEKSVNLAKKDVFEEYQF